MLLLVEIIQRFALNDLNVPQDIPRGQELTKQKAHVQLPIKAVKCVNDLNTR